MAPPTIPPAPLTNTPLDGFLRAIAESPDDDTPRMVLADWLQEQGNPWGEFIRLQCLLARREVGPYANLEEVLRRSEDLQLAFGEDWFGPHLGARGALCQRGFVVKAGMDEETTEEAAAALAARPIFLTYPLQRDYEANIFARVALFARLPHLGHLKKFEGSGLPFRDIHGAMLLGSPHLEGMEELTLDGCALGDEAMRALADNPAARSLRLLHLGTGHAMEVSGNLMTAEGIRVLSRSPFLVNLVDLSLEDACSVGNAGVRHLLQSKSFPALRKLNISGTDIDDDGLREFALLPFLAQLEELTVGLWDYQQRPLRDGAGMALASSPHLGNIRRLDCRLGPLAPATLIALRQRFGNRVESLR